MPAVVYAVKMTCRFAGGVLAAEVRMPLYSSLVQASQVPVRQTCKWFRNSTLHSINISLKSIMSLLNEIKAKCFKSCFSLVSANVSVTPDADYFSTSLLSSLSLSPPLSHALSACLSLPPYSSHTDSGRDLLNLRSLDWFQQFYELLKCSALTWGLQQPPHQHCHGNKVAGNSFSP